ncbi:Cof-type HAD-IIB family hydrolase [Vagococcus humatus]|uniref:Cof-type HAD-IIB family hydrolase n=1 Tax=Vagococcus humatus TaxID=1889241 RepID=A0A429Z4X1_9ENTE|nr:Cof-type HAD-IIB family hydrolase [Vagococcus humatus]RST88737.1 Cof-type HAD-IIB family hydrolase [Vagococcus humatus]
MKEIKGIAFFDLDGTLLDGHSKITKEIANSMQELYRNHVIPVIATGRTNLEITSILNQTGIKSSVTMNGQVVTYEGERIFSDTFSKDACLKLHQKTQELGQELAFYNPNNIYLSGYSDAAKKCYSYINSGLPPLDPTFYEHQDVNMMLIIGEDQDEQYHQALPDFTYFRNGPFAIDVIKKGNSKGTGVKQFLKNSGLEGVPTYAFGDGPNDLDLFHACDYKIAMGNAVEHLKDIATFVTKKNTDGGIIHGLKHYQLLD